MSNNVGLDIFIGLVSIFLLYSLLASLLGEMFATAIALRARNLREAVDRMLNDEEDEKRGFGTRLMDSMRLTKKPKNPRIINFYNHPEIKYLGSSGIFKVPSQFQAVSFSKTILNLLNEIGFQKASGGNTRMKNPHKGDIVNIPPIEITRDRVTTALDGIVAEHKAHREIIDKAPKIKLKNATGEQKVLIESALEEQSKKDEIVLDEETAKYVYSMWYESQGDLVKFKVYLETWFDRTMEQCLEWYKRKIQVVLLVIGFMMAWIFNADTFRIIHHLSSDKDARDKLVSMATAYSQNASQPAALTDTQKVEFNNVLTSLKMSEEQLKADMAETNNLLGLSGWLPNVVSLEIDQKTKKVKPPYYLEPEALTDSKRAIFDKRIADNSTQGIEFGLWYKLGYFFYLLRLHFWGYVLMALAVSLGAPFWFDLLNKIMRLRTAVKQPLDTTKGDDAIISPINRIG